MKEESKTELDKIEKSYIRQRKRNEVLKAAPTTVVSFMV